jgi:hypothetical protein
MLDSPGYAASLPRFVKTFDEPLWLVLLGQENPTLSLFHRISTAASLKEILLSRVVPGIFFGEVSVYVRSIDLEASTDFVL